MKAKIITKVIKDEETSDYLCVRKVRPQDLWLYTNVRWYRGCEYVVSWSSLYQDRNLASSEEEMEGALDEVIDDLTEVFLAKRASKPYQSKEKWHLKICSYWVHYNCTFSNSNAFC